MLPISFLGDPQYHLVSSHDITLNIIPNVNFWESTSEVTNANIFLEKKPWWIKEIFLLSCRSFTWGVDSVHSLKFNPVETNILGATASDRSIILYDMRGSTPLRKVNQTSDLKFSCAVVVLQVFFFFLQIDKASFFFQNVYLNTSKHYFRLF